MIQTYFKWLLMVPLLVLAGCVTTEYVVIPDSYLEACYETPPTDPVEFVKLRDPYKREAVLSTENISLRKDVQECGDRVKRIRDYQTFMTDPKTK